MVEEQWVIWRYSKQIVQQPSFPGRSALPGYHFKSADSFPSSRPPYFPGVETEGREVQNLARGQSRPAGGPRHCSAPQEPGQQGPGLSGPCPRAAGSPLSSRSVPSPASLPLPHQLTAARAPPSGGRAQRSSHCKRPPRAGARSRRHLPDPPVRRRR